MKYEQTCNFIFSCLGKSAPEHPEITLHGHGSTLDRRVMEEQQANDLHVYTRISFNCLVMLSCTVLYCTAKRYRCDSWNVCCTVHEFSWKTLHVDAQRRIENVYLSAEQCNTKDEPNIQLWNVLKLRGTFLEHQFNPTQSPPTNKRNYQMVITATISNICTLWKVCIKNWWIIWILKNCPTACEV